jgi:hypothetical protein
MSDLFPFLYAVVTQWAALMGVFSLIITLWLRARGKQLGNKIFWIITAFCFLLAFFFAWRSEHIALDKAQKELADEKDKNSPKLSSQIEKVVIGEEPDGKGTEVFVLLSVGNVGGPSGGPSIAVKYKLRIETGSFQHSGDAQEIDKEYPLADKITIRREESLVRKTNSPIPVGQRERGWLRFIVPDVKSDSIRQLDMKLTVSFIDVSGKSYSAEHSLPKSVK